MARTERLLITLTKDEKKELRRRAKASRSSMSSVVRKAIYSDRDTHIEEWMLQTIERGQVNGAAQMKAERLLEHIRAFEGHVPDAAFRKMEEGVLSVIDDCAMLRRQVRDDLAEMRREIGLPPIERPQHRVKTLADANLKYWQEAAREAGIEVVEADEEKDDDPRGTSDEVSGELDEILEMLSEEEGDIAMFSSEAEGDFEDVCEEDHEITRWEGQNEKSSNWSAKENSVGLEMSEQSSGENLRGIEKGDSLEGTPETIEEEENAIAKRAENRGDRYGHLHLRWDILED